MGVGEIAGLIAAIAFAILAGFMIYPLIRLGKLFDQLAETVKETGDHAIPALDESVTTVQQVNKSLEDVNKISAAASTTANNVSALTDLYAQVLNLLRRLQKERGITYLFIAHDLSVMRYISDRIAVIHKGRIVELAGAEELTAHAIHPYTRSLLSSIPMPDPRRERQKKLLVYDPAMHDYSREAPQWRELRPEHFVLCSAAEAEQWLLR